MIETRQRAKILAGVVRNGTLTHAETRFEFPLDQHEGQPAVLVLLPMADRAGSDRVHLQAAGVEIERLIGALYGRQAQEEVQVMSALDEPLQVTKADGCEDC